MSLDLLSNAHPGASCATIVANLYDTRFDHPRVDRPENWRAVALALRQEWRALAGGSCIANEILNNTVFDRVIADYYEPSAPAQCLDSPNEASFQVLHF